MKLIVEQNFEVECLVEGKESADKKYYIHGPFLVAETKNRNGRIYPKSILEREVKNYQKLIDEKRAISELGHPETPTINLERVSHMITSLEEDGNNWIGRAKLLDTPMGKIAKTFIDEGVRLGVSSRGMGSLKPMKESQIVQDDFYLAAIDIVSDPSGPGCFVNGILEGKEYLWNNGIIAEADIAQIRKEILGASRKQLEEVTLRNFEEFMKKL